MPITLPCRGCNGGGPGRCGGGDGGCGHDGQGGPLPCYKRNPILASNSRNSTLATFISPLPHTPAPLAAVPPPPFSCCRQAPVCYCHCAGAGLWRFSRGQPLVEADRGESWSREEGEARGRDNEGGGPEDHSLPVRCTSAAGGEGLNSPTTASFAIHDCCIPRLAVTRPCHQLQGEWQVDNKRCSSVHVPGTSCAKRCHRDHWRKEDAHIGGHDGREGTSLRVWHH